MNGNTLTGRSITWSSTNPAIAVVSATGLATAVSAGSTVISATSEGKVGQSTVTVSAPPPAPVASVSVSPSSGTLNVGQALQLTATLRDASGNVLTGRTVTWASTNALIAGVNSQGLVTTLAAGTVTITASAESATGQSVVTVTAIPPPGPGTLSWFTDWRTGTGTGTTALRDGSGTSAKWSSEACTNPLLTVMAATGFGFPAGLANVLRTEFSSQLCRKVVRDTGWATPAIGDYVFYRLYFRDDMPDGANGGGAHLVESHIGDIAWALRWQNASAGTFRFEWVFPRQAQPDIAFGTSLQTGATYRVEWRLQRVDATTAKANVRIYNSAGVLLADGSSLLNYLGASLAIRNPSITGITNVNNDLRSIDLGQSGQLGATAGPGVYVYMGGLAVRVTNDPNGWIGQYPVSGGEVP
jgi:hypothetical protein